MLNLKEAVAMVFTHRQTSMRFPVQFSKADIESLENYWSAYYKELNHVVLASSFPATLQELIAVLNTWLRGAELPSENKVQQH
jgi:hypothetical protein